MLHHCFCFHVRNFSVALQRPFATRYLQLQPLAKYHHKLAATAVELQRGAAAAVGCIVAVASAAVGKAAPHVHAKPVMLRPFSISETPTATAVTRIESKSSLTTSRSSNDSSKNATMAIIANRQSKHHRLQCWTSLQWRSICVTAQ